MRALAYVGLALIVLGLFITRDTQAGVLYPRLRPALIVSGGALLVIGANS